ncbi:MAG: PHP domain-containing protein [Clostridia bacterium]|nr:PHP domain-containing protein [Clostridia bacterium]
MYKYEIHLHTSGCSKCGTSTIREMVLNAKEKGFKGFVVTDHFYHGNTCIDRNLPWNEFVEAYEKNWLEGKALGEKHGIDVIFGIEEIYTRDMKEVLIYGITPEELKAEADFINYDLRQVYEFVNRHEGFLSHAHPFRNRGYIKNVNLPPDPNVLHGVEVFNYADFAADCNDRNLMALEYAKKYGLRQLSGGDVHKADSRLGSSGIAVDRPIHDTKALAKIIRSGEYRLIVNGRIL